MFYYLGIICQLRIIMVRRHQFVISMFMWRWEDSSSVSIVFLFFFILKLFVVNIYNVFLTQKENLIFFGKWGMFVTGQPLGSHTTRILCLHSQLCKQPQISCLVWILSGVFATGKSLGSEKHHNCRIFCIFLSGCFQFLWMFSIL